mgnify:CR=1 FL=1
MLNLPLSPDLDGKTMTDNKHNTPIFLESSINPFAIANDDIDLVKTIKNSIDYVYRLGKMLGSQTGIRWDNK